MPVLDCASRSLSHLRLHFVQHLPIVEYFSYGMIFVFLPFADSSLEAETELHLAAKHSITDNYLPDPFFTSSTFVTQELVVKLFIQEILADPPCRVDIGTRSPLGISLFGFAYQNDNNTRYGGIQVFGERIFEELIIPSCFRLTYVFTTVIRISSKSNPVRTKETVVNI